MRKAGLHLPPIDSGLREAFAGMTMAFAPLVYGYEDAIADLVVDRLGEVSLAGRVFDQQYLAGAALAALAVARGDLHARVEIDDVLTSGGGVPVEIIGRRNFAEDDAGCRQAFGKLAAARLLDPLDLDVPEVRLPARVSVEVVYPHCRPPSSLSERGHSNGGADLDASVSTQSRRGTPHARFQAKGRALDQMPGQEGERCRRRQREQEHLPPFRPAAEQPDDPLLDRPAIDVDAVGQIAVARRRDDRQARGQGEPQSEVTAEQREKKDELAQRHAEDEAGQGQESDAAVEDAGVTQFVEDHAGGEEADQPAPAAQQLAVPTPFFELVEHVEVPASHTKR